MKAGRITGWPRRVVAAACLIGVVALWFFLGPRFLGGPITYTVISGQSMEPVLVADDLALIRERSDYKIGDAIAYRSRSLGGLVVLHRIVAIDGERFVMKGDNNDFLDSDQPREQDVLGQLWVDVPGGGIAFGYLRSPAGMTLAALLIMGTFGAFAVPKRSLRRRRKRLLTASPADGAVAVPVRAVPPPPPPPPNGVPPERRRPLRGAAAVLGVLLVTLAGCTVFLSDRSTFRAEPKTVPFVHSGEFSYSAPAPRGPVYAGATVTPGDPVFFRLIDRLDVGFDYALDMQAEDDAIVTGGLDALVASGNGWQHRIHVVPARSSGSRLRLHGTLDLSALRATVARVERMTGMAAGPYTLTLIPTVGVVGTIAGQDVETGFSPELRFAMDEVQLTLLRTGDGGEEQGLSDVLKHTMKETVSVSGLVPDPLTVGGFGLPLATAQRVSAVALTIVSIVLVAVLVVMFRRRPRDEAARIQARYGALIVPVADGPERGYETVDVIDIETLVRLARQFEQPVMHQLTLSGDHVYSLYYDGMVYRFSVGGLAPVGEVILDDHALRPVVPTHL